MRPNDKKPGIRNHPQRRDEGATKALQGEAKRKYFEHCGALMTADGSDDHLSSSSRARRPTNCTNSPHSKKSSVFSLLSPITFRGRPAARARNGYMYVCAVRNRKKPTLRRRSEQ